MSRHLDKGISAPPSVPEGGTIPVEVTNGATTVLVSTGPSKEATEYPVVDGKVSVPVPPGARNGTLISIMTVTAVPEAVVVEVISSE